MCVCVCVRERDKEREREGGSVCVRLCVCLCVCVCAANLQCFTALWITLCSYPVFSFKMAGETLVTFLKDDVSQLLSVQCAGYLLSLKYLELLYLHNIQTLLT